MNIAGRKIAITGAGRSLGAALAIVSADLGALPILLGRSSAALSEIAGGIEQRTGRRPPWLLCDLADAASVGEVADTLLHEHPDLDILVNSGATWIGGPLMALADDQIAAMIDSRSANPVKSIRIACGWRALSFVSSSMPVICGIRWSDITMCTSSSCMIR